MTSGFRLGIDVGGTFTDAVLLSEADGRMHIAKVPSTPTDPSQGFVHALTRVLEKAGMNCAGEELGPEGILMLIYALDAG